MVAFSEPRVREHSAYRESRWGRELHPCVELLRGGPRLYYHLESSHSLSKGVDRSMFEYLSPQTQIQTLQRENQALKAYVQVLEDALVELAAIVTEGEK